jgi:hypothetical protein
LIFLRKRPALPRSLWKASILWFAWKARAVCAALLCAACAVSCAGAGADITLKADGSGEMTLEYRVSEALDSLGRLDGNAKWQPVPAGEADLRRSAARIDGMRLVSFSSKTESQPPAVVANTAAFAFDSLDALLRSLDGTGYHTKLVLDGEKTRLTLILTEGNRGIDPDLLALFAAMSEHAGGGAYDFALTIRLPSGGGSIAVYDGSGKPLDIPGADISQGKTLSFRVPMARLLSVEEGVTVEIGW